MDAPKCQNFPSCGKNHYGPCGDIRGTTMPKAARHSEPARPKSQKKSKSVDEASLQKFALSGGNAAGLELLEELIARIESLEDRVEELEGRKKYMRDYMRDRRKG